ncbi:hypothetical protein RJZ56_004240 [Blastomyces dermatitidis]
MGNWPQLENSNEVAHWAVIEESISKTFYLQITNPYLHPSLRGMASQTKIICIPQALLSSSMGALCQRYKTARLQFDDTVWAERLQNPQAKTFVVVRTETTGDTEISAIEQLSADEWLGMIVLLRPRALPADGSESKTPWNSFMAASNINQSPDPATIAASEAAYVACSMFVLAEARRQGLGRKLVQASVEDAWAEAMSMRARQGQT